ncbi:MAG: YccF domain-containing protein [Lachnospiraceae bacterium]|nr:YccF domain-containing protein [Lachnospiraceae bacterium]
MKLIGNILWFIFGGLESGLAWVMSGCLWCITIIGIPYGLQCFKFASLSFWPFGKTIEYEGGSVSFIVNVFWFIFSGLWMAMGNFLLGCLWCITIIGIPFGKQFFKIAKLSLAPFGAQVYVD